MIPFAFSRSRSENVVLPDGTTVGLAEFAMLLAAAKRHDGFVDHETQRHIDQILATAEKQDGTRLQACPVPEEPESRRVTIYGVAALVGCLLVIAALGFGQNGFSLGNATSAPSGTWGN